MKAEEKKEAEQAKRAEGGGGGSQATDLEGLNSKDPQLLARIGEEERRAKAPKSPTSKTAAAAESSVESQLA
jgi:hypothetical protein